MKRVVIAILAAALILLAATFGLNGIAAKRAQEEHLWLMRTLLADEAATFQVEPYAGEDETIRSVHKSEFGYVIETVTRGYADEMTVVVGVSNDGRVTGLVVLDAHETMAVREGFDGFDYINIGISCRDDCIGHNVCLRVSFYLIYSISGKCASVFYCCAGGKNVL